MKHKTKKLVIKRTLALFGSIVFLLLPLLLTGCAKEEPLYKDWKGGIGRCCVVKSDTNVFDLDAVTLSWHYGKLCDTSGGNLVNYDDPMQLYCYSGSKSYFLKETDDLLSSEKYLCDDSFGKYHHGMGHWEEITIPREAFDKESGWFSLFVNCVPTEENYATFYCWIALYYKKISNDRVLITASEK